MVCVLRKKPNASNRWHLALLMVFFGALALRLIHFSLSADNPLLYMPVLDETYYIDLGKTISEGHWLGEKRAFFMDPLYGYLLGTIFYLFGDNLTTIRLLQIVLDSLNVVLIYFIGATLWNRPAGMIAAVCYAVYNVAFFYTLLILKTTLTVTMSLFFILALLWVAETKQGVYWYLMGILSAVITYLRANLILMVPFSVLFHYLYNRPGWRKSLISSALLLAGLATLLLVGTVRNYVVSGEIIFLNTQSGRLLYSSNNPENLTGRYNVPAFSHPNPEDSERDFHREAERRLGRALSTGDVSGYWLGETFRFLIEKPGAIPSLLYNKLKGTIGNYEVPNNHSFYLASRFSPLIRWPFPTFAFAFAFGVPGLVIGVARNRKVSVLLVPIVTVCLTIVIFYTSSRFRMPVVPFLILGTGICLSMLAEWIKSREAIKIVVLCCVVISLGALSFMASSPKSTGTEEFFLAKAYWRQKKLEPARSIALQGADMFPSQARFQVMLGMISLSANMPEDAIRHNLAAMRIDSHNVDAHHNMGLLYLTIGEPEKAIHYIMKAMSIESRPSFFFSLAKAYDLSNDTYLAVRFYKRYLKESKTTAPMREQATHRLERLR
jgi:4-amino-4-deoxy-L-arabinose transferase-like glycosyltransferase